MVSHHHPLVLTGTLTTDDELTQVLVPFHIRSGITAFHAQLEYTGRGEGNAVDLGVLGPGKIFRGYSGGARLEFRLGRNAATPGYIPGEVQEGEWYIHLGPYSVRALPGDHDRHDAEQQAGAGRCDYTITVTFSSHSLPSFKPYPAPLRIDHTASLVRPPGQRPSTRWLKGDLHAHSEHSDGKFTLPELADKAVRRGLDFFFSTEHNTYSANQVWGEALPPHRELLSSSAGASGSSDQERQLLVGRGIEVTTRYGHWTALGLLPDQLPDARSPSDADERLRHLELEIDKVHASDGFAVICHPFAPCRCCGFDMPWLPQFDGVEVWNGPWRRDGDSNERGLAKWDETLRTGGQGKGWFVGLGGSDVHEPKFEIGEPTTHVLADEVSSAAVIRGMREGRVFVTKEPQWEIRAEVRYEGQTAGIGDWIEVEQEGPVDVTVHLEVKGFPEAEKEIRVITEEGELWTGVTETRKGLSVLVRVGKYVRIEIREKATGEMWGLTNPIWVVHNP